MNKDEALAQSLDESRPYKMVVVGVLLLAGLKGGCGREWRVDINQTHVTGDGFVLCQCGEDGKIVVMIKAVFASVVS